MLTKLAKRDRALLLRERLARAMAETQTTQSALARAAGVDRSTISQLLKAEDARLPNAQLVAECASALGVSADWLLGLTDRPERAADLVAATVAMPEAPRALIDERIFGWHQEAAGYKIRHVPTGMPDILKTEDVLRWEYEPSLGRTTEQAIGASTDRRAWMMAQRSDYEIALPLSEIEAFAAGAGYWRGLADDVRAAQLEQIAALHDRLYPTLRLFFFDARRMFSAPLTIFGPLLAVVYVGSNYLAFRDTERVQVLTRHFDSLVRDAVISDRETPDLLARLRDLIGGSESS